MDGFFDTAGRLSRARFAWQYLPLVFCIVLFMGLSRAAQGAERTESLFALIAFAFTVLAIFPAVKRFHDLGHSGWWVLSTWIPLLGLISAIYLLFGQGAVGSNQYGHAPVNTATNNSPSARSSESPLAPLFSMTSRAKLLIASMLLLLVSTAAGWTWLSRPGDYDECILQNMKGATLREAAWAIEKSCRAKFPEACYAWQKAVQKKGLFADLDAEYGTQPEMPTRPAAIQKKGRYHYIIAEYGTQPEMPTRPPGCSEVLATP
jgi:uncharacterized membrane protein YhaH (DUF805 family)